ncbi:MAG TPA: sulfite oxidase [Pusillimonas sp.]|uniref:SorT family sulfite dehydrogenase catalytic subunit n=1 Tax=unclassified Pusillimonas TaxID=2640016 RepID=UPI0026307C87|nr:MULTISPECIES: sulfite oxidase [unclassified Pusillimonas]HLU20805.1 sulfite oxidase [Pusillimonas sp.]
MEHTTNKTRRRLLATAGGAVAWAGLGAPAFADSTEPKSQSNPGPVSDARPLPDYAKWKDADSLIVHSANTIETRRTAFGSSGITPLDRLFVRNNVAPPSSDIVKDPDAWQVKIEGVKNPRTFTVAELKNLGVESVAMVLQCSGNGRAYFPHDPSGTQWTVGAAGCVVFTGVPVKEVLKATGGMADGMKYMTGTGGEEIPAGLDPNSIMVERSVPLDAIEDALLAWEINGVPLPLAHGGPLRMIIPGYAGVNNVKYIKRLAFTQEQSPANIQQNSYRMSPVGVKGTTEHDSVWGMPPKSWINIPSDPEQPVKAGKVAISGVAMGGMSEAEKIEVSLNGGKDWKEAEFIGPDLGKYAWRNFVLVADLKPGEYELASRVTNDDGETQPENRVENNRGYLNNSWRDHMVKVKVV